MHNFEGPVKCKIQLWGDVNSTRITQIFSLEVSCGEDENQLPLVTLEGELSDYAAVFGLLNYLYGQRLTLVSFQRL